MSRLSSARAGIPSVGKKSKFRGFRREHWAVCHPGLRAERQRRIDAGLDVPATLTRTWREHEPLIVTKYSSVRR